MDEKLVNNWNAANELEKFKQNLIDPLKARLKNARIILNDPEKVWKEGEKDKAKKEYSRLQTMELYYDGLYEAVMDLIRQHEMQTNMLTEIYAAWYNKVADKGKQPVDMMSMQVDVLQQIFQRIYDSIKPLNLEIEKPKL